LYDSDFEFIEIYEKIRKEIKEEKVYFIQTPDLIYDKLEKKQKAIIITLNQTAKFLEELQLFDNKYFIYCIIFDNNQNNIKENLTNTYFDKIIYIKETNYDNLLNTLNRITKIRLFNDFIENVNIKAGHHFNSNEACVTFMFYQIIFDLFDTNKLSKDQSKNDFILFCKEHKSEFDKFNPNHLKIIEQETLEDKFIGENLINWYTLESFFYHLLNRTIREENLLNLFRLRYIFHGMKNALLKYKVTEKDRPLILYRASKINEDEMKLFNEANVGDIKIIQLLGFISCTPGKQNTKYFAEKNFISKKQNEKSIVYRIEIDDKHDSQMFNIKEVSAIKEEDEILVNYDTFIKINSIEESNDKFIDYYINCSLSDFKEIKLTIDPITLKIREKFSLTNGNYKIDNFYLAFLYIILMKGEELETLLERTECISELDLSFKVFFFGLAYIFQQKYPEALEFCNKFLSMTKKLNGLENEKHLINYYMKTIELMTGKSTEIIEVNSQNFEQDEIMKSLYSISNKFLKYSKNEIESGEVLKAISSLNNDQIKELGLPIDIIFSYEHILKSDFSKALEISKNTIPLLEKTFGKNHAIMLNCYLTIGICFREKNLNLEAKKYFQKCLEINGKSNKTNQIGVEFAYAYFYLGDIYYKEKKYSESLENYKNSYKFFENNENEIFVEIKKQILNDMGDIYNIQNKRDEASESFHSCLKITETIKGGDEDLSEKIYEKLSEIYKNKKKYREHIEFLEKLLSITEKKYGLIDAKTQLRYNPVSRLNDAKTQLRYKSISISYLSIGFEKFKENNLKETLENMEKSLIYCEKSLEIDLNHFECIYELHLLYWKRITPSLKFEEMDKKINQFTKILHTQEKKYGKNHPLQGPTYYFIAKIYHNEAKYPEAFENYKLSLAILEKVKDVNNPDIIKLKEKIDEILKYFSV